MKKTVCVLVFLLLITFTVFSVREAPASGLPSSSLRTQKTEDGNTIRTDYVDANGKLSYATDKHYASVIRTYEDGRVILEQYFDAEGKPALQTLGHCAVSHFYTYDGLAEVITYLDQDGQAVITSSGYQAIHRTYNDSRLAETDTYYIEEEQVRNAYGYYSRLREYDEKKRVREIRYYDENGQLTFHKNGYAIITRTHNEAGRTEYEFYFDTQEEPVAVYSGYYGLYREYDKSGRTTLTTYLDAEGLPMDDSKGYATVTRTYAEDGSVASVRYFSAEGTPVTIGRGQYGVEYVNGRGVYLDEDGEPIFRLDNYLNTHPMIVLAAGVILTVIAVLTRKRGRLAFLIFYLLFITVMTVWYRESGAPKIQLELFWSYRQFVSSKLLRQNILNNIWLFVPLGAALFCPEHRLRWLWAVALSVLIEAVQALTGIGLCEIDDVISNGLGAIIGFGFAEEVFEFIRQRAKRRDPGSG
ncbi:MAG: VanZ family protein [Oscillospiraceae bacterium]|nr:VanZ family protein [Oscillospiraceae bacterium]